MKSPVALLCHYLGQLWVHLSIVQSIDQQSAPATSTTKINRTYLRTFLAWIVAILYGTFGLHLESGQPLTISSIRSSCYLFWRQAFIRQIWPQIDAIFIVSIISMSVLLFDFTIKRPISAQYRYTIDTSTGSIQLGGKDLNTYQSTRLLAAFHYSKLTYNIFGLLIYSTSMIYCYAVVFWVHKIYIISPFSVIFIIFGWPFIEGVIIQFMFANLTHIILSACCIQTRQQFLCQQMARLLAKLTQKRPKIRLFQQLWPIYQTLNRIVLHIGLQLEAFNTFWTLYLTLIFLKYTVFEVMFIYIVFFAPADGGGILALKCILIAAIFEMTALLFGLIQYCARVVKKNDQIGKLNRRFAVHCLRYQTRYQLRVGQLLKIETLQWPRLLHFYAFKVFGHSRITSKTFYAMAINISGFFLFVMKRVQ